MIYRNPSQKIDTKIIIRKKFKNDLQKSFPENRHQNYYKKKVASFIFKKSTNRPNIFSVTFQIFNFHSIYPLKLNLFYSKDDD